MKDRKEYMRKYYHEHKQRPKQYYLENIDKIKQYKKEYYEKNKEKRKEYSRKYAQKNKEKKIEYSRKYYQEHKELCRIKRRIYYIEVEKPKNEEKKIQKINNKSERKIIAEYIILHKEEIEEMKKQRSKEKAKVYQMLYFQNNKDKIYKKRGITKC